MRPGALRRLDVRRARIYGGTRSPSVAPFASDLVLANYADRGITLATGVAAWADVVGARDFVQADTSKQAAYSLADSAFGNKPALTFDGIADFMQSPTVSLSSLTSITFAISFRFTGTTNGIVYESDSGVIAGRFVILEATATTLTLSFRNTAASVNKTVTGLVVGTTYRLIFVLNASVGATTWPLTVVNGVTNGSAVGTSDRGFSNAAHYIGARGGTTLFWPGKMGDILTYNRALTAGEIATVDAYLASRCT